MTIISLNNREGLMQKVHTACLTIITVMQTVIFGLLV
jgi:hypothetical protein